MAADPETCATSMTGLFAGGDLTPGAKTVIHAIADGRRAAWGIDLHLAGDVATVAPVEFLDEEPGTFTLELAPEPAYHVSLRPAAERVTDSKDVVIPLTEAEAREEAARCLVCAMCSSCSA